MVTLWLSRRLLLHGSRSPVSTNCARRSATTKSATTSTTSRRSPTSSSIALLHELERLEAEHPDLVTPDSPTQRVAGRPIEGFPTVEHLAADAQPRQRLQRGRAAGVRRARAQRRRARRCAVAYVAELKIDGLSIALTYEDGRLSAARRAATACAARTSPPTSARSAPSRCRCAAARAGADRGPRRGAICRAPSFERINREREEAGEPLFANPRNAAAGTMRNLDPALVAKPPALARSCIRSSVPAQDARCPRWLHAPYARRSRRSRRGDCRSSRTGGAATASTRSSRSADDWADGAARPRVRHRRRRHQGRRPRAARAAWGRRRSFRAGRRRSSSRRSRRTRSCCRSTSTSAGPARTRRTPSSSRCSSPARRSRWRRCTTPRTSRARTCARGTRSSSRRRGDVIPRVVAPILSLRPADSQPWVMPTTCAACGSELARDEEEVVWRCENTSCPARLRRSLEHFASRTRDEHRRARRVAGRSADRAGAGARLRAICITSTRRQLESAGRRRRASRGPNAPSPRKLGKVGRNVVEQIERSKQQRSVAAGLRARHPPRRREGGRHARAAPADDGGDPRRAAGGAAGRSGHRPGRGGVGARRSPTSRTTARSSASWRDAGVNMESQQPDAGRRGRRGRWPARRSC